MSCEKRKQTSFVNNFFFFARSKLIFVTCAAEICNSDVTSGLSFLKKFTTSFPLVSLRAQTVFFLTTLIVSLQNHAENHKRERKDQSESKRNQPAVWGNFRTWFRWLGKLTTPSDNHPRMDEGFRATFKNQPQRPTSGIYAVLRQITNRTMNEHLQAVKLPSEGWVSFYSPRR